MILGIMGALVVLNIAPVPDSLPKLLQQSPWIPGVIGVLCVAKLVSAGAVFAQLQRHQLVTTKLLGGVVGVWIGLALLLFFALWSVLPAGLVSPLLLAGAIVLFLPLTRLSFTPLALYANRHR